MTRQRIHAIDETAARQLVLLRAFESADAEPWTAADRDWATRVARASLGDNAAPCRLLVERAHHAMQRLAPRDAGVRAALGAQISLLPWSVAALLLGLLAGLLVDQIGPAQRINLLAPPIWLLVLWNLAVLLLIVLGPLLPAAPARGLRRWLQALWRPRAGRSAPLQRFALDWAAVSAPINGARAALLLHLAAAALAAGVGAGLYLRGLVLDYRAGWQSTFLEAPAVHAVLGTLLAPASAATGITLPDVAGLAALQVQPGQPAQAPAAPWLHLYAATLGLFVIGPRLVLAAWALLRLRRLQRRLPLPLHDPWYRQWLQPGGGLSGTVWLLPHAAPASAALALDLQAALADVTQGRATLQAGAPVPYGDEADAAACTPPPGTSAVLLLLDLATTPEAEVHGRLLDSLARAAPQARRLLLLDEAGYQRRLGAGDPRLAERRAGWQQLAAAHDAALLTVDLGAPTATRQPALVAALGQALGQASGQAAAQASDRRVGT